jgi:hypothetical protein
VQGRGEIRRASVRPELAKNARRRSRVSGLVAAQRTANGRTRLITRLAQFDPRLPIVR